MAGIDIGAGRARRRATNSELNMIPFIDLLLVTTAFLLITAVWATNSRLNANAEVPGKAGCQGDECAGATEKKLHVHVEENSFRLTWKQAGTVLSDVTIPKDGVLAGNPDDAAIRYPELAKRVEKEWSEAGAHRDRTDRNVDLAVVHTDDRLPFRELAAVLDAIESAKRDVAMPNGQVAKIAAFNPVFSIR